MSDDFQPPEGFNQFPSIEGFADTVGPLYIKMDDQDWRLGFRVMEKHCNPAMVCHGGMLMAVMDMAIGMGVNVQAGLGKFTPSVNLTYDFLRPGKLGDWLESRIDHVEVKRAIGFASGFLTGSDGPVLRANGIVHIPRDGDQKFTMKGPNISDAVKQQG